MASVKEKDWERERGIEEGGRCKKPRGGDGEEWGERLIYRSRGEGPREDERQGEDG